MFLADTGGGYEILDTGDGMKLESWGGIVLSRPDPQVIWPKARPALWQKADGEYMRSSSGGGQWRFLKKLPERWTVEVSGFSFYVRPTGFKHTGLFPEQCANWQFMQKAVADSGRRDVSVLNLFAYTGGATVACAKAGAAVTHVDAAKSMVAWAKENAALSGLLDAPIPLHGRRLPEICSAGAAPGQTLRRHRHGSAQLWPRPGGRGLEAGKRAVRPGFGLHPGDERKPAVHAD